MPDIAQNLSMVREQIAEAARLNKRDPKEIRLLAVSKTFPTQDVAEAFRCGQTCFGENRVQELEQKVPALPSAIEWHLIGHLQSNKVTKAAMLADWVHSVDSEKLIGKLDQAAKAAADKTLKILLEINISGEESKFGLQEYPDIERLTECALAASNLNVCGLMTMAEPDAGEIRIRKTFEGLRKLRDKLEMEFGVKLPELSMGMSGDYPYAIAEGSTIVRIGSAIFGNRG